jgi:hypothetical protein
LLVVDKAAEACEAPFLAVLGAANDCDVAAVETSSVLGCFVTSGTRLLPFMTRNPTNPKIASNAMTNKAGRLERFLRTIMATY